MSINSIVGVPGGLEGKYGEIIQSSNSKIHNFTLVSGSGSDEDTINTNIVYVMDSDKFSFTQAEVCLQFHDDSPAFAPPYSSRYRGLKDVFVEEGKIVETKCPSNYIC